MNSVVPSIASPRFTLAAAVERALRIAMLVHPQLPSGDRVERVDRVLGTRQIHDPVDDERRGLELLDVAPLEQPFDAQVLHVLRCDLVQPAVAPAVVRARIHEPVAGLLIRLQQPLVGHRPALAAQRPGSVREQNRRNRPCSGSLRDHCVPFQGVQVRDQVFADPCDPSTRRTASATACRSGLPERSPSETSAGCRACRAAGWRDRRDSGACL